MGDFSLVFVCEHKKCFPERMNGVNSMKYNNIREDSGLIHLELGTLSARFVHILEYIWVNSDGCWGDSSLIITGCSVPTFLSVTEALLTVLTLLSFSF